MTKGRLEAFSDGVFAIIITIMVLELRPPEGAALEDLGALWPAFLAYLMSFALLGIWWANHHHLLHLATKVNGAVLMANLYLLFWISLFPFGTAWVGDTQFAPVPLAVYAGIQSLAGAAYYILVRALIRVPGQTPALVAAIGRDLKGKASSLLYLLSIPIALIAPAAAVAIFVAVAALWIIPDRRMERALDGGR
ncbi:MAG TPA: TMEM175 family protein [Candidatus Limnocylindria bacterium]|nr:TMEM175 family protein [Candidatus Limnocylindria bacterium]